VTSAPTDRAALCRTSMISFKSIGKNLVRGDPASSGES
jgi:hypothetical protein